MYKCSKYVCVCVCVCVCVDQLTQFILLIDCIDLLMCVCDRVCVHMRTQVHTNAHKHIQWNLSIGTPLGQKKYERCPY